MNFTNPILGCTRQAAYLPDGSAYTPASMETDAERQARMRRRSIRAKWFFQDNGGRHERSKEHLPAA